MKGIFAERVVSCNNGKKRANRPIKLSANVFSRQFMQAGLVNMVQCILEATGVDSEYFELELTGSMLMADAQQSIEKRYGFRKLSLTLSIDDFGTDHSPLVYLNTFQ